MLSEMSMLELERMEEMAGADYSNELELSHAIERMETRFSKVSFETIQELTSRGFYVVVESWVVYGKITDAFLGHNEKVICVSTCLEEAEEAEAGVNSYNDPDYNARLYCAEPQF